MLPADVAQHLEHVAIADLRAREFGSQACECLLQAKIGHQRADHAARAAGQPAAGWRAMMNRIWSPSISRAVGVDHQAAVGVAVQRDAEIGAMRCAPPPCSGSRCVEPQSRLMLKPSGSIADRRCTSAPSSVKHGGRRLVARRRWRSRPRSSCPPSVCVRERALAEFDVAALRRRRCGARCRDAPARTHCIGCSSAARSRLDFVGQLGAVRPEELEPLSSCGLWERGNDDAGLRAQRAREIGHARRRQRTEQSRSRRRRRRSRLPAPTRTCSRRARVSLPISTRRAGAVAPSTCRPPSRASARSPASSAPRRPCRGRRRCRSILPTQPRTPWREGALRARRRMASRVAATSWVRTIEAP